MGSNNKVQNNRFSSIEPSLNSQDGIKIVSMKEETTILKKLEEDMAKTLE